MSIIEKAAGKIGTGAPKPGVVANPAETARDASLIESALSKQGSSSHASPFIATTVEPIFSDPDASVMEGNSQVQSINLARLHRMGVVSPDAEKSKIAEEFRIIKRPLIANAFGQGAARVKNGNLIMVTSSLPGEGKSFCAINLAISMAMEMDRTVLLIDADVAKPRVPEYLGIHADKGLLDVLQDKNLKLSDVMIKTDIAKLTILPAGRTYKRATELLASAAMTRLIEDIGNRYPDRIILFDSPPLLATSESSVLATHMGQIVMVVEAEKTSQDAVREALSHIQSCEVVGMLLNKTTPTPGADYYYGHYGSYGK
ncbi:MAG TPA: XrtA-associated tyrosine autokinase [Thiobacillus sp.]|nr:MAG: protein tyrosine kinase [Hydrogenophilales bacterium 28-61-11]OYZ58912.1 MAG: protein tyrosine kinase [Hydrogenophilales bacterium 16-61-112]OZA46974.1 MAG: protein tyrosine kinase [Hydrogenophilales bacterium 17-61-76]HQT30397.1 XrtA-associated tyrosine autokinase [Thiobacillus sp.]HQT68991.1 XrtA-associated tyrosine autokinase [Thiobacillus sp.]